MPRIPIPRRRLPLILLGLIVLAGALLRVTGIFVPIFGDESCTTLANITRFFRERTILPEDTIYPTLYSYMEAVVLGLWSLAQMALGKAQTMAGAGILFITDQAPLIEPLRLLTVLFDAGTIAAAFVLGRRLRDWPTGLAAALFVALSQNHLHYARWALPDVPMAFFATLSLLSALRLLQAPTWRAYLLAGLFAGLAASCKYNGATITVAIAVAHLLARHPEGRPWAPRALMKLLGAAGVCVGAFLLGTPAWILQPGTMWATLQETRAHMVGGHHFVPGGAPYLWIFHYLHSVETSLGILAVAGLLFVLVRRRRELWVVLAPIIVSVGIIGLWQKQSPYYLLMVWPAWLTLGALVLRDMVGLVSRRGWVFALAVLGVIVLPSVHAGRFAREQLRVDNRVLAERWIQENIPAGAKVAVDWGYLPALYDVQWMREADERRRAQFAGNPDLAIWQRFAERTRAYELIPMTFDVDWLQGTDARYAVTATWAHERFLSTPPPPPGHPFHEGFMARRNFYSMLLADRPPSPYRVVRRFDHGAGPSIIVLQHADPKELP